MLRISGMENSDNIISFSNRSSSFIFKLIYNLESSRLAIDLISTSYQNERHLGCLTFFDILTSVPNALSKSQFLIKPKMLLITGILAGCRCPPNHSKPKSMNNVFKNHLYSILCYHSKQCLVKKSQHYQLSCIGGFFPPHGATKMIAS